MGRSYVIEDSRCKSCRLLQQAMIADYPISIHCLNIKHGDLVNCGN